MTVPLYLTCAYVLYVNWDFPLSDLSNITIKNLVFCEIHVKVYVHKSKTDVNRRGNKVLIAKTGNKLCTVSFLLRYIKSADLKFNFEEFC